MIQIKERKAKALALYAQGYKVRDIAALCGVSDKTVWRYLGHTLRKKKNRPADTY